MSARRVWALVSVVLVAASVALAVVVTVIGFPRGLSVLLCVALAALIAWYAVRRRGATRALGTIASALLLAGTVVLFIVEGKLILNLVVLADFVAGLAAARAAFRIHVQLPPAAAPEHPVMFYNPLSGGGKAERFHLADAARRRGIEPIELQRGVDLEQLVRAAVRDGAGALAMAGGDGSQAIVAKVAAELDLPYACIPAGTRSRALRVRIAPSHPGASPSAVEPDSPWETLGALVKVALGGAGALEGERSIPTSEHPRSLR
jgi:hypothetical protein